MDADPKSPLQEGRSPAFHGATCYASPCGRVTLYLGDSLAIAPTLKGVDALISDPPYGIGFKHSGTTCRPGNNAYRGAKVKGNCKKIEGDDKPFDPLPWLSYPIIALWGADHYAERLPRGKWMTWDKLDGKESWDSFGDAEHAWINSTGATRIYRYLWKGLCQGAGEDKNAKRVHPTQKPVCVMKWIMDQAKVPENATVLDPFMGSGTTGVACVRTGRRFVGIECDPEHFANAVQRITNELAQGDLFLGHNRRL